MTSPSTLKRYRRALQGLRSECPLLLPVRVVLSRRRPPRPGRSSYGAAHWAGWSTIVEDQNSFRIVVRTHVYERGGQRCRRMHGSEIVETLIHEWAHCMAWTSDHAELEDHGPAWGVAYAKCYRAIIED